ncbi:unnamed protein product [Acanthoscelides obtectus]|uniref:Death domain-containing protein n=1 Tax=Acanthoscelides obtectus TaxID=200917 RepID=A0A9P0KGY0_ACAOB|nr:unnamed protein product [Acanthoscelides obtectus]CAK1644819.1 Ankyrin-3 [Acanthoscelides obtectus]
MDCRNVGDATKMATELYKEAIHVPFMAKFVVFAKRVDPLEARLRVFCMTDDKEDKTLEHQEHFTEVAKSRDVEVLEGKPQYVEFAGNLVPVTKSGDQLSLPFRAFRENRLPFSVRVKDPHAEAVGRCLFMKEPKVPKGEPPQQPVCILNIVLPEEIVMDTLSLPDMEQLRRNTFITENFDYYRPDPRLADMSNLLGLTTSEINVIKSEYPDSVAKQAQSMLRMWLSSQSGNKAQSNTLENALRRIGREDIIPQCLNADHHQQVSRVREEKQEIVYRLKGETEKRGLKDKDQAEKRGKKDKYSAEEKVIESPEEEEDEPFDKPVAERREKIEKRLSAERTIPASSQRKEIVQEITTIKQERLVEDKIAEVQQKQEQSRSDETTKTTTSTRISPDSGKTVTKTVETVKATIPTTSTVFVTGETTTKTITTTTVESRTTQPEKHVGTTSTATKTVSTTHKPTEDHDLLEGVTESFEKVRRAGPKLIADEEPRSPKVSKTPPPSPADFLNKEQTTTIQAYAFVGS